MKKTISITGHRKWPDNVTESGEFRLKVMKFFKEKCSLVDNDVTLIHGCARGVDLWFGNFAMEFDLKLSLYLPFPLKIQMERGMKNYHDECSLKRQVRYENLMEIKVINKTFSTYGYQKRNKALVDDCDIMLGYFTRSRSGSGNAARYYEKHKGKKLFNLKTGKLFP